jgi:acyl carrier protein
VSVIESIAREHLSWNGQIRREQRIIEALRLDSLRLLTLVVEIENRFRIVLDETATSGVETVGDLVDVIGRELEPGTRNAD